MRLSSKTILALTTTALCACSLMTSCCKHDDVQIEEAIMMGTDAVSTKSVVTNLQSLIDQSRDGNTGFGVYGYKTVQGNSTPTRLFNNTKVTPETDNESTLWTYNPIRFWDSNPLASYQFSAYWPYLPKEEEVGNTEVDTYVKEGSDRQLLIYNIPNWQDGSTGTDYLVTTERGQYRDGDNDETTVPKFNSGKVIFKFEHLLAQIKIQAYYVGIDNKVIKVHGIRLKEHDASHLRMGDGTINCTQPLFDPRTLTAPAAAPVNTAPKTLLNLSAENGVSLEGTYFDENPDSVPKNFATICTWLTAPSTNWDYLDLEVDYSVDGSVIPTASAEGLTLNSTVTANNVTTVHNHTTLSGYTYVITLKLSASNGIELESIVMKKWDDEETSTNVYNW
jgi:hypothetical protein